MQSSLLEVHGSNLEILQRPHQAHSALDFWVSPKVISCIIFGSSTTALYQIYSEDARQDSYIFGGFGLGIIIGLVAEQDLQSVLLKILPWTILLSMLFSILGHRLLHLEKNKERF